MSVDPRAERLKSIKCVLRSLLIARAKEENTVRKLNNLYREEEDMNIPYRDFGYNSIEEFLINIPDTVKLFLNKQNEVCVRFVQSEASAHVSSLVARQKIKHKSRKKGPLLLYQPNIYRPHNSYKLSTQNAPKSSLPHNCNCLPDISVLSNILVKGKEYLSSISSNRGILNSELMGEMSKVLNGQQYTLANLSAQLNVLASKHNIHIASGCIYYKDLIQSNKSTNDPNGSTSDSHSKPVPKEKTRVRLLKLLQKHPEGIWCAELPNLYKDEYVADLKYENLGFSNISEFVNAFPDIFIVSDPMQNGKLMVTDANSSNENVNNNYLRKRVTFAHNIEEYTQPEPDLVKLSCNNTQPLIPDEVMGIHETVEQIHVKSLIHEEYIKVQISEIFTPSFFWIQLLKANRQLAELMNQLQEYYTASNPKLNLYKIPQALIQPSLNIACKYDEEWHRGMIKEVMQDGSAMVWFYDYGTVERNKAWELPMVAFIREIDEEKNSMMVSLVDVSDEQKDLYINDWMVENGYAEYGRMVRTTSDSVTPPYCGSFFRLKNCSAQNTDTYNNTNTVSNSNNDLCPGLVSFEKKLDAIDKREIWSIASEVKSLAERLVHLLDDRHQYSDSCRNERVKNKFEN
ncbi:hypothetical protein QAD02_016368 [Eretmocerus hayati]|uniref:Uncharacterized protein n=1 Tax=Eretmocerus hayati TaxID=131215 RepID=A0ACC2PC51_9HYME|nr:hypothetical protein QAD02_016368 [Eretmocerus hayati]